MKHINVVNSKNGTKLNNPFIACGDYSSDICGKDNDGCGSNSRDCCATTDGGDCGAMSYDCTDSNGQP